MERADSLASLSRLPKYLAYLKVRRKQGDVSISSTRIAQDLRLNPVQVRKDIAVASGSGRPRVGYPISVLIADIEMCLGYHNVQDAFLVGAGRLGRALLGYDHFAEYGLNVMAAFDIDTQLHGTEIAGKPVFPMEKLRDLTGRMEVLVGILTVPETAAQTCCDLMVEAGFRAIWSFAVTPLTVPEGILVKSENLAAQLASLTRHLSAAIE